MATYSWNFTTAATFRAFAGGHAHTRHPIGWSQLGVPRGWLPAPSQPSSYLPPVSYRRVSGGDLYPAASPSLALFSVAERDEQGNRKQRHEMSAAPVFALVRENKCSVYDYKLSLVFFFFLHKDKS